MADVYDKGTVRQETTRYKAATLPLNMYNPAPSPGEKVVFTGNSHNKNQGVLEPMVSSGKETHADQESEYNEESDKTDQTESDDSDVEQAQADISQQPKKASIHVWRYKDQNWTGN